ncbi:hypothetical protein FRC17_003904 [Serendipita sp. 399]|nr:hypothetical protein FRC17_003904 [Serendipita sp. 399]
MPNRRITIILNANQQRRITVLIPLPPTTTTTTFGVGAGDGDEAGGSYSMKEHILTHARNKFHNKYLSRVYLWGGDELSDDDILSEKEEEVLVSKGEAYIGPPKARTRQDGRVGQVIVLANHSFVHEDAIKQLNAVAGLEGVHAAIGMPDLHKGDRFPIGCAIIAEGIYPALIGSDIGCGISLYPLGPKPSHLTPEKLGSRLKNLDDPWEGDVKAWLRLYGIERETEFDASSLGTVGAGNHFAEVLSVDRIVDAEACESLGIEEKNLYLLAHTGSRGLGASILRQYTRSDGNPYLPVTHPEYRTYLDQHDHAVLWAKANRDLLAHRFKTCVFGSRGSLGTATTATAATEDDEDEDEDEDEDVDTPDETHTNDADPETGATEEGGNDGDYARAKSDLQKILDVTHNSVSPSGIADDVNGGATKDVWIHRKGAAPSDQGFVPCPGSRGDFSWILQPMGDGERNVTKSLFFTAHSLAHGAGRLHPRNAPQLRKGGSVNQLTTTSMGSYVVCTDPDLLVQERPEAYKSVQAVVDDMEEFGIAEGVAVLRPFVTFKTGAERRK